MALAFAIESRRTTARWQTRPFVVASVPPLPRYDKLVQSGRTDDEQSANGFFKQRGFLDIDTVSSEAYVGWALEGKDRTILRVWIEAGVLFSRGADGGLSS